MQRSMLTRLSTALIIPAMVLLSSAAAAQDATPEAAADRATAAELEEMLGPLPTPSEALEDLRHREDAHQRALAADEARL